MPYLELALVAWLPGAVVFRLPWLDRDRRAALPAEERAYWTIVISSALSLILVLTLAALHRYSFRRLLLADAAIAVVLALTARFDLRFGSSRARIGVAVCIPLALAGLAAWRFLPPSEYIIGGKDPGVYVNAGVQIAQRGTLVAHDAVVANVPASSRDLFFPVDANKPYYLSVRFMGFFIQDPDTGAVVSQFQHAYPASVAIGYGLNGLTGARDAVVFWGILGVLGVYFTGARLLGRPAAATAAALLTLNVVQVWFARYPNVEVLMQALLFAAILANARAHVDRDPFFSPVAGSLLGLLLFARFDAAIAVGCMLTALALARLRDEGPRWTFWPPLAAAVGLCGWYLLGPMRAYLDLPRTFVAQVPAWELGGLAVTLVAFAALLEAARRRRSVSARLERLLPWVLAVAVPALAAYAYVWRQPGGRLAPYDAHALRTFAAFYLTVPGLIAAVLGYAICARRLFWRDPAFVLTFTAFACIFFYKIRIVPEHFWMTRRFLPVVLPGAMLFVGAAALGGVRGRLKLVRAIRWPIGAIFVAMLALQYARASKPVAAHVEYEGVIQKIEKLAGLVADDELLIVESRDAGSDVHVFGLPLAYIYGRNVLVLASAAPDKAAFAAFLDTMHARYRRVLFLGGGGTDLLSSRWTVEPLASDRFQVPEYASPRDAYPRGVTRKEFEYTVYAFGPPAHDAGPVALDLGVNDDLNVVRFHAKETTNGVTFRWTEKQSFLILTHLRVADRTLALWMNNGGRPPAAPPADVTILLGDRVLGTVRVANGFREYDVELPSDAVASVARTGEPVRIMLRSTTWNPQQVLGTGDDRDLGVMIDRVAVR